MSNRKKKPEELPKGQQTLIKFAEKGTVRIKEKPVVETLVANETKTIGTFNGWLTQGIEYYK